MKERFVAIMMGSANDFDTMKKSVDTLNSFGIKTEVNVLSAHRTPKDAASYVEDSEKRGCAVYIAAAGLAAHLAGAVAANTVKPVIGVPIAAGTLGGIDALLSTVQMPGGTPVACVSIGSAGAVNAAVLAAEILAVTNKEIHEKLLEMRAQKRKSLHTTNKELKEKL